MINDDLSDLYTQPDIFSSSFIKYNRALKFIVQLKPYKAKQVLDEYRKNDNTGKKLDLEYSVISFLKEVEPVVKDNDVQLALDLWEKNWEQKWRQDPEPESLLSRLRKSYFRNLSKVIAPEGRIHPSWKEIFMQGSGILIMIRAGLYHEASSVAKKIAEISRSPGRIHGYRGDSLFLLGDKKGAAESYLTALFIDPCGVDVDNLCCPKVKELLLSPSVYIEELDIPNGPWNREPDWPAAIGMIYGIFKPPEVLDSDQALKWKETLYGGKSNPGASFAAGMVLSAMGMKSLEMINIEISSVRKHMKETAPELFEIFMKNSRPVRKGNRKGLIPCLSHSFW